jgi:tRNA threonylcarbamoyladenosine biosynthesis protein TsaE
MAAPGYEFVIEAPDLSATAALGAVLARCLPDGTLVALEGPLGAGKTALVKAVAEALGVDPAQVTSPTFVLMQVYEGSRPIVHLDAFRLERPQEFAALAAEEFFPPDGLVFIEWYGKVAEAAPVPELEIRIEILDAGRRRFVLRTSRAALAQRLSQALAGLSVPATRASEAS